MTGHAQGHISDIEQGLVNVHLETASLFARSLGMQIGDLVVQHPDISQEEREQFGRSVYHARVLAGWSRETLASLCQTNRRMIEAVERGGVLLTIPLVHRLGRVLDLETEALESRLS